MGRQREPRRSVQVRFPDDVHAALADLARREGWTWDHGGQVGARPSVSEAVRRLVGEALAARSGGHRGEDSGPSVSVSEAGMAHVQGHADRLGTTPDEVARRMLTYAAGRMRDADYRA